MYRVAWVSREVEKMSKTEKIVYALMIVLALSTMFLVDFATRYWLNVR